MCAMNLERFKIRDIMTKKVYTVESDSSLSEAIGIMNSRKIHELVVVKHGKLAGILTYDHLSKHMNLPMNAKVENLLALPPKLSPDDSIITAAEKLISSALRAAPVTTKDNVIVGIVSKTDIIKIIPKIDEISAESVGSVMSHEPVCVSEDDTVSKAKGLMKELDEQTLPVIDSTGKLTGLVGMKEIGNILWSRSSRQKHLFDPNKHKMFIDIKSIMTLPLAVPLGSSIGSAVEQMLENSLPSIVVTANEKPIGILTQADLVEILAKKVEKESVYVQITGLAEEDPYLYESLYAIIQKGLKRIARMSSPQMLLLHVSQYSQKGSASKYSIRARFNTIKKMYYSQSVEWDIMKAADELMRELEMQVRKDKERFMDRKKMHGLKATLAKYER